MSAWPSKNRLRLALIAASAVLLAAAAFIDRAAALQSWLFVWWFLLGLPLGSMAVLAVHNMTGGRWGELIRPELEAALRTLPLLLLLSIPLWLGARELYAWARPAELSASPLLQDKTWYLDLPFMLARAAVYFAAWLALSHWLRKWSFARVAGAPPSAAARLRAISAFTLLIYALTITVAAVDWIMSLDPKWYSTTFGLLAGIGQSLSAFAFAIVCAAWRSRNTGADRAQVFHDLGNLLLMFVMVWAYLAFTQYLITWAEDLPAEIAWYLPRVQSSWRVLALLLVALHFAVPFVVLLSRRAKRAPRLLGALAALLLLAHLADAFWLVAPTLRPHGFSVHWSDLFAGLALGGVWLALFVHLAAGAATRAAAAQMVTNHV